MKKKTFLILVAFMIIGIFIENTNLLKGEHENGTFINLIELMKITFGQSDVQIICSATQEGRCFEEICEMDWTPFGPFFHTACHWTGWQRDFCVPGVPC